MACHPQPRICGSAPPGELSEGVPAGQRRTGAGRLARKCDARRAHRAVSRVTSQLCDKCRSHAAREAGGLRGGHDRSDKNTTPGGTAV